VPGFDPESLASHMTVNPVDHTGIAHCLQQPSPSATSMALGSLSHTCSTSFVIPLVGYAVPTPVHAGVASVSFPIHPMVASISFPVHPMVASIALPVHSPVNPVTLPVHSPANPVTLPVHSPIDSITLAVKAVGKAVVAGLPGSLGLVIEPVVDAVPSSI